MKRLLVLALVSYGLCSSCTSSQAGEDKRIMTLGLSFGMTPQAVSAFMQRRGSFLDSSREIMRYRDVSLYGRRFSSALRFKVGRLAALDFKISPACLPDVTLADSLYKVFTDALGKPTDVKEIAGYRFALWLSSRDTCGYIIQRDTAYIGLGVFASGRAIQFLVDSINARGLKKD